MAKRSYRGAKGRGRSTRRAPARKSGRGSRAVRGSRGNGRSRQQIVIRLDTGPRPYPGEVPAKTRKVF